jgi:hypothetical protein
MNTNRHEGFRGEAALECGGLTPLSGTNVTTFADHFVCMGKSLLWRFKRNL